MRNYNRTALHKNLAKSRRKVQRGFSTWEIEAEKVAVPTLRYKQLQGKDTDGIIKPGEARRIIKTLL